MVTAYCIFGTKSLKYNELFSNSNQNAKVFIQENAFEYLENVCHFVEPQCVDIAGLILGLHPANERQRYFVTASLIDWVQA